MMTRQLFVVSALLCLPASALLTLQFSMKSLDKALVMLQDRMDHARDSECSDSESVTKDTCLTKSAKCMWMELDNKNLCLPCVWSGINLPCVPFGASFGGHTVKQCEMQCSHQQLLTKVNSCVDTGGTITQDECFSKGQSALTKCMFTVYNTAPTPAAWNPTVECGGMPAQERAEWIQGIRCAGPPTAPPPPPATTPAPPYNMPLPPTTQPPPPLLCIPTGVTEAMARAQVQAECPGRFPPSAPGKKKTLCGPCQVDGVGKIPAYNFGQAGPEIGSIVEVGASMCDLSETNGMPCDNVLGIPAVTQCQPVAAVVLTPTAGAAPLSAFGVKVAADAPPYYASIVPKPFGAKEYYAASSAAMRAAGWPMGSATLPSAPAIVFGPPPLQGLTGMDLALPPGMGALYGPPPVGIPNIPFPGMGVGTAPPPDYGIPGGKPNPPGLPGYGTPGGVFINTRPAVKGDPSFDPTEPTLIQLALKKRITRRFRLHRN